MKTTILNRLILLFGMMLVACQSNDKQVNENLERQLDSVNQELVDARQELMDSQQIKALLDSIDASRSITNSMVTEENDGKNNIARLNDINDYIKDINLKMDQMEKSIKYVNTMAASILALQADVEARTQKIARLEAEAKKEKASDIGSSRVVQRKDSTLAAFIKNCQQDIVVLQKVMEEVHIKNNLATADIYFKQAETLAAMANNVGNSAKRKLVIREAVEIYKISYSLGKKEAQSRISSLEKEI